MSPSSVAALGQDAAVRADDAGAGRAPEWSETSLRGTYRLRQFRTGPGQCRLESVRTADSQQRWVSEACVATAGQLVFLAEDGDRFLVLEPMPEFETGSKLRAELGRAYLMGTLARPIKAGKLVGDPDKLRTIGSRFHWLAGVRDEEGAAPALVPEGVRFSTLGGVTRTLGFDGLEVEPPDAASPPAPEPTPEGQPPQVVPEPAPPPPMPSAAERAKSEEELAEAKWRASFREVREKIASLEKELAAAKAKVESIEKDGLPELAPQPRMYDPSLTVQQRNQSQMLEWQEYRRQISVNLHEARRLVADVESRLKYANDELEELERKARFAAVPLEWRK
ncbi:MAG: hypothetical protein QM765_09170 [Myxococcales bacterium]